MVSGSPAWKPHATFALDTTCSRASSSPSRHTPNPSPRSAFRSMPTGAVSHCAGGRPGSELRLELHLHHAVLLLLELAVHLRRLGQRHPVGGEIGRASCRERV